LQFSPFQTQSKLIPPGYLINDKKFSWVGSDVLKLVGKSDNLADFYRQQRALITGYKQWNCEQRFWRLLKLELM